MKQDTLEENQTAHPSDTLTTQAVLRDRREGICQRLRDGSSGAEVVWGFTDLVDAVLIGRYRNVVRQWNREASAGLQQCCLVALGGYGRRELALIPTWTS